MGLLYDYMQQFVTETRKTNGIVSRKTISEWFGNKQAVQRDGYKDVLSFDTKAAVVVVGVSCIGKSTYVRNFLKMVPTLHLISYDNACYQKEDEIRKGKKVSDGRMIEIVEAQILEHQDESIIVDSTCIQPYSRAALMRFLKDLGYEIHMVYFSQKYTEAHINSCLKNRAVELAILQRYHNTSKKTMSEFMKLRENIVEIVAKEKGITTEKLMSQMATDPITLSNLFVLVNAYNAEVEENRMWWQEKRGLFFLGADYCYVL